MTNLTADQETYFKRGARIKPAIRLKLTEAMVVASPVKPDESAYALARANINRSWARRWLKANGYFL